MGGDYNNIKNDNDGRGGGDNLSFVGKGNPMLEGANGLVCSMKGQMSGSKCWGMSYTRLVIPKGSESWKYSIPMG